MCKWNNSPFVDGGGGVVCGTRDDFLIWKPSCFKIITVGFQKVSLIRAILEYRWNFFQSNNHNIASLIGKFLQYRICGKIYVIDSYPKVANRTRGEGNGKAGAGSYAAQFPLPVATELPLSSIRIATF